MLRFIGEERKVVPTVGIIPARYQSSRFPGKPLVSLLGKPMIQHVYERSRQASGLDGLYVATDDGRIESAVLGFGGQVVMTRPDHPSGTDRLAEACRILSLADDDLVVNIQGDEPLVKPAMIERLIQALRSDPVCAMSTLAFPGSSEEEYRNPNIVKVVTDRRGRALYFSRSPLPFRRDPGDFPPSYLKHLGFYAYRYGFLKIFSQLEMGLLEDQEKLEQLRTLEHGHSIAVALSPVETHGVDTPEDVAQVEAALRPLP
jgi:3-deoxy-manno-octulosonate cytidylyltransferase (CMP-KDO synthetase)